METLFWIGPYKDFKLELSKIPGLLLNECNDQLCTQYRFKLYDETVMLSYSSFYIFNIYVY